MGTALLTTPATTTAEEIDPNRVFLRQCQQRSPGDRFTCSMAILVAECGSFNNETGAVKLQTWIS